MWAKSKNLSWALFAETYILYSFATGLKVKINAMVPLLWYLYFMEKMRASIKSEKLFWFTFDLLWRCFRTMNGLQLMSLFCTIYWMCASWAQPSQCSYWLYLILTMRTIDYRLMLSPCSNPNKSFFFLQEQPLPSHVFVGNEWFLNRARFWRICWRI